MMLRNAALTDDASEGKLPVTDGELAMINLQAQIDGQEKRVMAGCAQASGEAELIELIALRGQVLGRISDYEAPTAESSEGIALSMRQAGEG